MTPADWPAVREIYADGIATGNATFETTAPEWATWDAGHTPEHRFVAVSAAAPAAQAAPAATAGATDPAGGGAVVGWVACSPVSARCVYAGVLELSVYVSPAARGRGVGSTLLAALVASTEAAGVWTLQTGIFPENEASLALHARHGFRVVGTRERLGRLGDTWRDVVLLERRSSAD